MATAAVQIVKERLGKVYRGLGDALADGTQTKLELKRNIRASLGIDPGPERLQLLADLAALDDAPSRDLCLRLLSALMVVEDTLGRFERTLRLDPAEFHRHIELLPIVQATSRRIEADFQQALETMDRLRQDAARALHRRLTWPDNALESALTVGAQLERLASFAQRGTLVDEAPSLTDAERALIEDLARAGGGNEADEPLRARLDGIAMRTLIERHLDDWRALPPPGDNDTEALAGRMKAFELLERDRNAYRAVSARLNETRARSFVSARAGADDVRRAQQRLFTAYRSLTRVLNAGPMQSGPLDDLAQAPGDDAAARIQRQMIEAERAGAEIDAELTAREDLLRHAATDEPATRSGPELPRPTRDLQRERRRRRLLVGLAASLVPISLVVNLMLLRGGSAAPPVSPEDFEAAMPVQQVVPVLDRIMNTQVSTWLWDNMSHDERWARVEAMGQVARQDGYTDLHVLDESNRERAMWTAAEGTTLFDDPAGP